MDDDYERMDVVWERKRYWHTGRLCWVENWVGEMKFGKPPPPAPDALIDRAAAEFVPLNTGRKSSLEGRIEAVLEQCGPCDSQQLANKLSVQQSRIRKYAMDHSQRIECTGKLHGRNVYRLIGED